MATQDTPPVPVVEDRGKSAPQRWIFVRSSDAPVIFDVIYSMFRERLLAVRYAEDDEKLALLMEGDLKFNLVASSPKYFKALLAHRKASITPFWLCEDKLVGADQYRVVVDEVIPKFPFSWFHIINLLLRRAEHFVIDDIDALNKAFVQATSILVDSDYSHLIDVLPDDAPIEKLSNFANVFTDEFIPRMTNKLLNSATRITLHQGDKSLPVLIITAPQEVVDVVDASMICQDNPVLLMTPQYITDEETKLAGYLCKLFIADTGDKIDLIRDALASIDFTTIGTFHVKCEAWNDILQKSITTSPVPQN